VQFNVARSGGVAAYVVGSEQPVGIDLERVRPIKVAERIAARLFSRGERLPSVRSEWRGTARVLSVSRADWRH